MDGKEEWHRCDLRSLPSIIPPRLVRRLFVRQIFVSHGFNWNVKSVVHLAILRDSRVGRWDTLGEARRCQHIIKPHRTLCVKKLSYATTYSYQNVYGITRELISSTPVSKIETRCESCCCVHWALYGFGNIVRRAINAVVFCVITVNIRYAL